MSYLLDTNVLSELRRKTPEPKVAHWIAQRPAQTLYLSVLTLGEIRKGIDSLSDEVRRQTLLDWLEVDIPAYFIGRILDVDQSVSIRWGSMVAQAKRPVAAIDSLLAATACQHGLTLVTRNTKDFVGLPVTIYNPWLDG